MKITNHSPFPVYVYPADRHATPAFTVEAGQQSPELPDELAAELTAEFPERWTPPAAPPAGEKE